MADRQHEKTCKDCTCPDCNVTSAMAFRTDAWNTANRALTDAAGKWPGVTVDDDGTVAAPSVTPVDVLILANWLFTGEGVGGGN